MLVYIGTYTRTGKSQGIYVHRVDESTGRLSEVGFTTGISDPSYLALHPNGRFLYSVSEVQEQDGRRAGSIYAYVIDPPSGKLSVLNHRPSQGTGPCYVSVEKSGKFALVANYQSGSIGAFPIGNDGRLGEASSSVQHQGSSVNKQRQQGPHAHCIVPDPSGKFVMVADLGMDKVMVYRLDLTAGKLTANHPPSISVAPGAGPRHIDFHPNGRYMYLINEIGNTITAFEYDGAKGTLKEIETMPSLPLGWTGENTTADIHVAPSGKFVYGSNRGHDSIVIYVIDGSTGKLTYVGHEPTRGKTPRNFAIDPSGTWLFAENQNSDTIHTFKIDQQTGRLTATGDIADVPSPVCMKFLTR
ncbi:MAG: lactonase family protein [Chloroflexi bacterium]|nr:lactonase family protein [Chloroflexota bacterium]